MCQFEGLRRRVAAERRSPRSLEVRRPGARGGRRAEPAGAGRAAAAAVPGGTGAGGRMELNSLLILLEAAEYLERRDREAEHGYASVLPFDGDFTREKTKAASLVRKAPNNRRAKLRLYLEQLKQLVPLGPDSTRHTTLSLLKRAKVHIKKLEEQDRRALSIKEQLQQEHRFLKRRLEQLSVQSVERVRTDSTGSAVSTDDSEQEVDIEGMEFGPGELDSVGSSSDADDHYSLQSGSGGDSGFGPHCRRLGRPALS
ncbi:max dimerization protein 4 isoform X2 [Papio anubis]|uniref:max dimerization protein 4 isoform X2 n=1 Tax=Papio anubis TaxID=9555 RepID=UPI00045DD131|nr:max dimerization protein 4 isoform X2 [Chlorocebus sabaeus]XP_031520642.1 max dimerization protein 4 isoform X2 [Papio anubis]XP_033069378.1 max dimerization protein 4 isoform X2 [Trachypithecus francoisi]